jgi:CRP/FNR family transcriptional regulator, cyclic AMP receptor protein
MRFTQTPQTLELLSLIPLFNGMSQRHLKAVAKAAQEVIVVQGQLLTRQGEPGDELILIADGTASVKVNGMEVARKRSGDVIGEMCLIDGRPRSATVTAETSMTLLVINRRAFNKLLDDIPGLARKLLVELSSRLRDADDALAAQT